MKNFQSFRVTLANPLEFWHRNLQTVHCQAITVHVELINSSLQIKTTRSLSCLFQYHLHRSILGKSKTTNYCNFPLFDADKLDTIKSRLLNSHNTNPMRFPFVAQMFTCAPNKTYVPFVCHLWYSAH